MYRTKLLTMPLPRLKFLKDALPRVDFPSRIRARRAEKI
jgi:hypothetical protein